MKKILLFLPVLFCFMMPGQLHAKTTHPENYRLWYTQPADEWLKAIPVGNGRLGAMIYGGIKTETIALNEITMWSGQYDENQEVACGKEKLDEMRQLFFQGKIKEGHDLAHTYLQGRPNSFGTHLPVGDFKMNFGHDEKKAVHYMRQLDLENSVTSVSYEIDNVRFKREYICSNPDDVFLIKLTADTKAALNIDISLDLLRESDIEVSDNELTFSGQALFSKFGPGGVNYIGKIRVSLTGGEVNKGKSELSVRKADEILIAIDIRTDFKSPGYKALCDRTVHNAFVRSYEDIKRAHISDYTRLYDRTELYLGQTDAHQLPTDIRLQQLKDGKEDPGLFTLFFQYGRYLLISCSRENSPLPANLQGIWNDNLACNMPWTCDYHLDMNTQQNYWLANIGNLAECNSPLISYVEDLSNYGEKTAMKVYGSRGWTAHTVANVWGYTAPGQSYTWGMFPTGGIWIASHLWNHYLYTKDGDFLRNKAYPILKKSVFFLLDYMVENPHNGYLMTGPSISPENSFKTNGIEYSLSMMPTCDRVLAYEAFTSFMEAAGILNVDPELQLQVKAALAKLPPIQIGKAGTVQEWFEDYDLAHPNHRHSSHLLALYPYNQISLEKTPELAKASEKSIYNQLHSEGWEDVEWSRANMICFYTRLKKPVEAYDNMKSLLTEFARENLFTPAPGGIAGAETDIYEFDANEAAPAAMAEMFLQSHQGYIEFLPCLPEQWSTGHFKGLCAIGGAEVDLEWENKSVKKALLKANYDHSFNIKLKNTAKKPKIQVNDQSKQFAVGKDGLLAVQLNKGDVLKIDY